MVVLGKSRKFDIYQFYRKIRRFERIIVLQVEIVLARLLGFLKSFCYFFF